MDDLVAVIRELRQKLGDTQQTFADRLGLSARAVANYEAGRLPAGGVILALSFLARDHGFDDLAKSLSDAYRRHLKGRVRPTSDEEIVWVKLILALVRNKDSVDEWSRLQGELLQALETLSDRALKGLTTWTDPQELFETLNAARREILPNASRELERLARERSMKTGEPYSKAYVVVLLDHPDLYDRYKKEISEAEASKVEEAKPGSAKDTPRQKSAKTAKKSGATK